MKRLIVLLCAVTAVIVLPQRAVAQSHDHEGTSPKTEFQLSRSITVGAATVTPGTYEFQCLFLDGKHFLVVTSAEDGREVARVPCTPEQLDGKVTRSDFRSVRRPDGSEALTAVRIKGETIAHRLVVD